MDTKNLGNRQGAGPAGKMVAREEGKGKFKDRKGQPKKTD